MKKPDDIPDSVWDSATMRWNEIYYSLMSDNGPTEVIARVIMDETEACVEVIRRLIPLLPADGPISAEHQAEYEALGGAMMAIRERLKP